MLLTAVVVDLLVEQSAMTTRRALHVSTEIKLADKQPLSSQLSAIRHRLLAGELNPACPRPRAVPPAGPRPAASGNNIGNAGGDLSAACNSRYV